MEKNIKILADKGPGQIRLELDYKPGIARIIIDNPERHNALSGKMMVEFHKVMNDIENNLDNDLVALVVMGENQKSFCAGLDLSFAREFITGPEVSNAINELMHDTVERLSRLPLITMAAVTGGAIGGGSELMTGFDFVCMSKESGFVHFVQTRMGISSPWGGLRRLVQSVGKKKALLWMAGGYRLNAEQCLKEGLADRVAETDDACLKEALVFLRPFIYHEKTGDRVSSKAVRGMKHLIIRNMKGNDVEYENTVLATTTLTSKI